MIRQGGPRRPSRRAPLTERQESPGGSGMAPDLWPGHRPVRAWNASAQLKICGIVNVCGRNKCRCPRSSASNRASDEPPSRPRRPGSGHSHFPPGVAGRFRDRAGTDVRPFAGPHVVGVGPRKDAFDRERNKILDVGDAPLVFEKLRQRGSTRETAEARVKRCAKRNSRSRPVLRESSPTC